MPLRACEHQGLPALRFGKTGRPVTYGHGTGRTLYDAAREAHAWGVRRSARRLALHQSRLGPARRDAKKAASLGQYSGRVSAFSERITTAHEKMLQSQVRLALDVLMAVAGDDLRAMERQDHRQDAGEGFSVLEVLRVLRRVMATAADSVRDGLFWLGFEMDEDVTGSIDDELSRLLTIPLATAAGSGALVEAWVADNVALITSLTDRTLGEVQTMVTEAMTGGVPTRDLTKQIQQRFEVGYSRASLIARDQTAKLAGRIAQERHQQYGIDRFQWSTSGDARVRQSHAALDGRIFTYAEGAPGESGNILPGEEFQCLPGDASVGSLHDVHAAFRRWYAGELTSLVTDSGEAIHATPNHPVLTSRGWIPAHLVEVGDYVFKASEKRAELAELDVQHGEATAQEVFDALALAGSVERVAGVASQFHGDGTDEEVDVVHVNRGLGIELDPMLSKEGAKLFLAVADATAATASDGQLMLPAQRYSSAGFVGGLRQSLALLGRRSLHADPHRRAAASWLDSVAEEISRHSPSSDAVELCQRLRAFSVEVAPNHLVDRVLLGVWRLAVDPTGVHAGGPHGCTQVVAFTSEALGDLVEGESIPAKALRVVEKIRRVDWSGHVYNFSTERQWYTTSNLIVHNCRCVGLAILDDRDAEILKRQAIARQEAELTWFQQESPTVAGKIPNYSGFTDWNAERIAALRSGLRPAVGLDE